MERATITVHGIVQGVGFRYRLRNSAHRLKIKGRIKNLDDGPVEIIAEGTRQNIESLIQDIRDAKHPIMIDDVQTSYQTATGEFKSFKIAHGDLAEEMIEGFSTQYSCLASMNNKQDQMPGKQDQMPGKQDQTTAEIRSLSNNMHDMMDDRFQRLENEIHQIKEKIGL